jgi:AcrR family transcriptional regulator
MDYNGAMDDTTPAPHRNDLRLRLLEAAIDVFGRHGFEGASTRMLAKAAGVNLQAIPYHFGGKEGLYLAVADHIGARIQAHVGPTAMRIRTHLTARPEGRPLRSEEARPLLIALLEAAAALMVGEESAAWARFIIREQMEPTEAFERIYGKVMAPLLETARHLVGALLEADADSDAVRLRTIALIGQILVLRVARAAALRQLGWEKIGPEEHAAIHAMIRATVAALGPNDESRGAA